LSPEPAGTCGLSRTIPATTEVNIAPFRTSPLPRNLPRLLIHLWCSNLQQIKLDITNPKHPDASFLSSRTSTPYLEEIDDADHAFDIT
jgi:hypothetical protein